MLHHLQVCCISFNRDMLSNAKVARPKLVPDDWVWFRFDGVLQPKNLDLTQFWTGFLDHAKGSFTQKISLKVI